MPWFRAKLLMTRKFHFLSACVSITTFPLLVCVCVCVFYWEFGVRLCHCLAGSSHVARSDGCRRQAAGAAQKHTRTASHPGHTQGIPSMQGQALTVVSKYDYGSVSDSLTLCLCVHGYIHEIEGLCLIMFKMAALCVVLERFGYATCCQWRAQLTVSLRMNR